MKGDFSRFTFRRDHHYSGVRMQQGRVQLDADWNEQVDIQAYLRNTEARDVIGVSGVPHERGGFLIAVAGNNFKIADGRIYVDGVLVENESEVYYRSETGRVHQPHYPVTSADEPLAAGLFLVYLDVWQRHITALEAPQVREVALGGPDTTTRMQTLWQARLLRVGGPGAALTCWDIPAAWDALLKRQHGALRARAQVPETVTDPCVVPAGAGYRRLENQLYRVEIHNSTQSGAATFKWSRDNGMVVTRVVDVQGRIISVADAGRDAVLGFANGQWVEISDDTRVLRGEPGVLVRVLNVVENTLEIEAWPGATPDIAPFFDPQTRTVRRWDHVSDVDEVTHVATGTVAVSTVGWIELEDGVQVNFDGSHPYDTGDYWLIPARTVNTATLGGTVEWPLAADGITPAWLPPQGIQHRYARLALLEWNGAAYIFKHDCRSMFPALTEPDLYYISGDGQEAMPGDTLPQVLAAGVSNCNRPIEGAWVKFALDKEGSGGDGQLSPRVGTAPARIHPSSNDKQLIIMTDALGEAACVWRLQTRATLEPDIINESPTLPVQQVRATLLQNPTDADALKLDRPLVYSASFGVASENQFGGSVFPDGQYDALIVQTVEDALDQLRENVALYYVGGDAQWVAPGPRNGTEEEGVTRVRLQHPLEVRVANGDWPYVGAEVEFSIEAGDGVLALESESSGGSDTLTVSTDSDGIARCYWDLDRSTPVQQVTARLNAAGTLTITSQSRIDFLARLNTADQITYDGSEFPDDQHPSLKVDTVEQALDQLRENTTLLYVGGDGQTVYPGEQLALPLQVRIANGQWPREGATVQFSVEHGTLSEGESSGSQITAFSNADGLVQCYWTPDADGPITQQAIAVLTSPSQFADSEDASTPGYVYFNAHLNKAEDSYYSPNSESLQESPPETVQGAIDELYGMKVNRAGDVMYGDLGINGELAVQKDVHIGYHSEWNSDSHLNLSPASQYAVVAINGGLHVGGDKDPGDKNAVIDGNLTVHGNLRVQGETVVVNTDKMQGNVVLGDEDADIITVEGRIITGHSSGALQVQSPLAVSGAAAFASNVAVGGVLQGNNIVNTAQIADASVTKAKLASDVSLGGADLSRIHRVPLLQQTLFRRAFRTATGFTNPYGLAFDGVNLWVSNYNGGSISKVDTVSSTPTALQTVTGFTAPFRMAFDGSFLWVGNLSGNSISKVDVLAATPAIVATVTGFSGPYDLAFDGTYMWVVNYSGNSLSKVNIASTTPTIAATLTGFSNPYRVAFDGLYIWVANLGANSLSKVDISAATPVIAATMTGIPSPYGLAFDGAFLWVANFSGNSLSKVDVTNNTVVAQIAGFSNPFSVVFDGTHIWVANYGGSSVSKIDINNHKILATVAVGSNPYGVAFDGDSIWTGNSGANSISKIRKII